MPVQNGLFRDQKRTAVAKPTAALRVAERGLGLFGSPHQANAFAVSWFDTGSIKRI
jgi:hypothetical protein